MSPVPFPARDEFYGDYDKGAPVTTGGQSYYSGFLAVTMLERDVVRAALASVTTSSLALATPRGTLVQHPVIHLVGHQRHVCMVKNDVPGCPVLRDYQELILLIPLVVYGGTLHNFAARMYLDNAKAVDGGNLVYAYSKELGVLNERVNGSLTSTEVRVRGTPFFTDDCKLTSGWMHTETAASTIPRWDDLHEYLSMPVLGTDGYPGVGRTLCSYFDWNLDSAQFATAESAHRFLQPFRAGMTGWVDAGPLTSAIDGAVGFRNVRWRIAAYPVPC